MRSPRLRRPTRKVAGNGGVPARRAVVRWAWRLFRREWRQQILVLALLTVAVAAAIAGTTIVYNVTPPPEGQFGTADHFVKYGGLDPRALEAKVDAVAKSFGTVEVIAHRFVPVPGSVETVDFRAQDPHGVYGAPMLRLREGRYPTGAGEVALTDEVAKTFGLAVGDPLALDGRDRTVVGLVENPGDLGDEFALVSPSHDGPPESVTILFDASPAQFESFRRVSGSPPEAQSRRNEKAMGAAVVLALATVVLLLVSLVAAAGFAVLGQRRLRQLGMLAAIGATEKHLRLVMVANGAMVGVIAAVIGTAIGLVGWIAAAPQLETAAAHRIDRLDLPWLLIGIGMLLAVVTATAAAWWPARAMARVPIIGALSARPPRPKPAHRSAAAAGLLIAIGVVCLALADRTYPPLIIAGTVATALGVLFISPLAIRALAASATRLPIAGRLAVRDLARYQARSGAALAAISLALGIALTIAISATAAKDSASEGNLPANQLMIRMGGDPLDPHVPERTPAELEHLTAQVDRIAASLDHASVLSLQMAVDPAVPPEPAPGGSPGGRLAIWIGKGTLKDGRFEVTLSNTLPLYVATPDLLEHYGIEPSAVEGDTDVLTVRTGVQGYEFLSKVRGSHPKVRMVDLPTYSSLPSSLVTPEALRRHGWKSVQTGWLVEARRPLTSAQVAAARDIAADTGITIEARDNQASLSNLRSGAIAAGALLALGVLAMTVGLIRGEAAGDLRTLTATGATSTMRRSLTAATTGALALAGVALGTLGAYLALIAWYHSDISTLSRVPVIHLVVTAVGLPLVAAVAGWLLAGREPPAIARQPIQ